MLTKSFDRLKPLVKKTWDPLAVPRVQEQFLTENQKKLIVGVRQYNHTLPKSAARSKSSFFVCKEGRG